MVIGITKILLSKIFPKPIPAGLTITSKSGEILAVQKINLNTLDYESGYEECISIGLEPKPARFQVQVQIRQAS